MHRQYEEVCKAQQEASARNKMLLEDVNHLQRRLATPAQNKLQQLKSRYEEEMVKLYPAWLEQVRQFRKQKEATSLPGADSQQPNSSHTPFVVLSTSNTTPQVAITTVVTNSNSNHVSSGSVTSSDSYAPSYRLSIGVNQSNQSQEDVIPQDHTPHQHSDISLASLSSGSQLSASHDLSISHDVSEDDDFWNNEVPPITSVTTAPPATLLDHLVTMSSAINAAPPISIITVAPPISTAVTAAPPISTITVAPPISTAVTAATPNFTAVTVAPPISTTMTVAPPNFTAVTVASPISTLTSLAPMTSITTSVATPTTNITTTTSSIFNSAADILPTTKAMTTIPAKTNVASLFIVNTSTAPVTSVPSPTSSSLSLTPISSIISSSTASAPPIMSAVNSSEVAATPIITNATNNAMSVVSSTDSSRSATPISDHATPPKPSVMSRPAATDSVNYNNVHQPSIAVLESSTSAGFEERVPLTETAAYQSLAKSFDNSSDISEGSAVLELEQLNIQSPVTTSHRQEGSSFHSHGNAHGVKVSSHEPITTDSDDESGLSLLPSMGGGSYVPSTLEQHTRKRTTPTSYTIDLKKLGILGGSEEEFDELPAAPTLETGQSNQLDDFDFYN